MENQDLKPDTVSHPTAATMWNNKIPFSDEIQHLAETWQKLDAALTDAEEKVLQLDLEYPEAKQYVVDYRNKMDGHEKLQNERLLEQTDRIGVFAVEMREKITKLKDSPYFARIDFVPDGVEKSSSYYIGRFGFSHNTEHLIFDWRSPVASVLTIPSTWNWWILIWMFWTVTWYFWYSSRYYVHDWWWCRWILSISVSSSCNGNVNYRNSRNIALLK